MTLIVYSSHELKLQADRRVTLWPLTDAHQCHIPEALSRAYVEEPGHMAFLSQRKMRKNFLHTPRISQRFASEWKFGSWCYDLDKNHIGHLPTLIPLFLGIFFHGAWHKPFKEGLRSGTPR